MAANHNSVSFNVAFSITDSARGKEGGCWTAGRELFSSKREELAKGSIEFSPSLYHVMSKAEIGPEGRVIRSQH